MKYIQSIITLLIIVFCTGFAVTSCMESHTKIDDIYHTVLAARDKFEGDKSFYVRDMEEFKTYLHDKYERNEAKISILRDEKSKMVKESYREKVEELEIANEMLKNKLETIQVTSNLQWKNFKKELNQDETNLDEAFKNLNSKI